MKKLVAVLILASSQCFATHMLTYFVYHQQTYIQGPWQGSDLLDNDGSYLYPTMYEGLYGSEDISIPLAVMEKLALNKPDLYLWNYDINSSNDTVTLYPDIANITDIEFNEIVTSLTQMHFCNYVSIVLEGEEKTFDHSSISIPYFTLAKPNTENDSNIEEEESSLNEELIVALFIGVFGILILLGVKNYWRVRK